MIEILNVEKVFKNKKSQVHALKNVSLRVEKGDIFGIVGYSGAGCDFAWCISSYQSESGWENRCDWNPDDGKIRYLSTKDS